MAKSQDYKGNVELVDGLIPANGNDFALMDAHYIMTEGGTRLDKKLESISSSGGGMSEADKSEIVTAVLNSLPIAEEVSV